MTLTLKHTKNVTTEVFSADQFGNIHNGSARRFNLDRLKQSNEYTADQLNNLSKIVMVSEYKGDCWTAYHEDNVGDMNSNTWLMVGDTLLQCLNGVDCNNSKSTN